MCGIVGYVGGYDCKDVLMEGLSKLEYRGYDSAGVALHMGRDITVVKAKGRLAVLKEKLESKNLPVCHCGIGHTRWATHGVPSDVNSHPHSTPRVSIVHNGIIENYGKLKEDLIKKGYEFVSETDTEVLVQLIEYTMNVSGEDLACSVRKALTKVIGAYAICVIDRRHPEQLVAARKSSPMVIGVVPDNSEFYIASDASPIAQYTKQMVYLNDEQMVVCQRGCALEVTNLSGEQENMEVKEVDLDLSMLDKGGFPHFMLKEIFDQPAVLRDCMRGRVINNPYTEEGNLSVILSAVTDHRRELLRARRIVIVSCGTSWHAGLIGKQLIEHFCRIPVEVAYASEFRYSDPVIEKDDVVIAISQSGETADTLAAIELAREQGALVFGIVNAVGSSIARNTDTGVYIHVGPEIGVASTKAFTGQVTVLTMIALALGMAKGTVTQAEYEDTLEELVKIPEKIEKILLQNDKIKQIATRFTFAHNFLYLGRGYNYPVALEGALKLKEISYIHAEGYPAAEMKHGPIALVDSEMPVVFIATRCPLYQKIVSNMQEVISRKGHIIAVVTEGDEQVRSMVDDVIEVPSTLNCLDPLLSVIPLQILSYHVAVAKGLDVDQPRNLAKSVTVE